jgi:peptide/nickel transport system substrate-binding protein
MRNGWFTPARKPWGIGSRTAGVCLAVGLLASASGCSRRTPAAAANEPFRLGAQDTVEARRVLRQMLFAEPLLMIDWRGRPTPRMATAWEWLEDGRALAVQLRTDVTFHDGTPLTPQVAASIMRHRMDPKNDGRRSFQYVTSVGVAPDNRLIFRLSRPDVFLIEAIAGALIVNDTKPDIGTGPFRLVSQTPMIRAERFPGYYRGIPGIDRVDIVMYDTQRAVFAAMMGGKLDMAQEVNPESVEFLEGASRFEMYPSIRPYYIALVFNQGRPLLQRVEVRRALAEAIDRQEIVDQAMRGHGQVADDPVWPFHWAYSRTGLNYSHNPHAAQLRLDAAGLPVRPAAAGGMASRFQIRCLFYNKDFQFERIALLLQRQLAAVGVDLVLESGDETAIVRAATTGNFDTFVFQMAAGKSFDWTYLFWHSPARSGSGYTGADAVLDRLRVVRTDAEIRAGVADLRRRFYDDVPAVFLAWPETTRAVDARFEIGDRSDPDIFANVWQWRSAATQKAAR